MTSQARKHGIISVLILLFVQGCTSKSDVDGTPAPPHGWKYVDWDTGRYGNTPQVHIAFQVPEAYALHPGKAMIDRIMNENDDPVINLHYWGDRASREHLIADPNSRMDPSNPASDLAKRAGDKLSPGVQFATKTLNFDHAYWTDPERELDRQVQSMLDFSKGVSTNPQSVHVLSKRQVNINGIQMWRGDLDAKVAGSFQKPTLPGGERQVYMVGDCGITMQFGSDPTTEQIVQSMHRKE